MPHVHSSIKWGLALGVGVALTLGYKRSKPQALITGVAAGVIGGLSLSLMEAKGRLDSLERSTGELIDADQKFQALHLLREASRKTFVSAKAEQYIQGLSPVDNITRRVSPTGIQTLSYRDTDPMVLLWGAPLGEGGVKAGFRAARYRRSGKKYERERDCAIVRVKDVRATELVRKGYDVALKRVTPHPNILKPFAYAVHNWGMGSFHLYLEELYDTDLEHLKPTLSMVSPLLEQVLEGLEHLHKAGVVHKDLKGSNVAICFKEGRLQAMLTDWDMAVALRQGSSTTRERALCGSPLYFAPELATKEEYGTEADMWSFGVMWFHQLAKAAPHDSAFKAYLNGLTHLHEKYRLYPKFSVNTVWTWKKSGRGLTSLRYPQERDPVVLPQAVASFGPWIDRCLTDDPSVRPTALQVKKFIRSWRSR